MTISSRKPRSPNAASDKMSIGERRYNNAAIKHKIIRKRNTRIKPELENNS